MSFSNTYFEITAITVVLGIAGYFLGRYFALKTKKKRSNSVFSTDDSLLRERLMQARNHTMRLSELESLKERVEESNKNTRDIDKSIKRLEVILGILDKAIEDNNRAWADSLLTRFSKHLRQLLHDGASSKVELYIYLEHIEGTLAMLSTINHHKWAFEIRSDKMLELDLSRTIKSMKVMPWLADELWPLVIQNEITSSVIVLVETDTFEVTFTLVIDDLSSSLKLPIF